MEAGDQRRSVAASAAWTCSSRARLNGATVSGGRELADECVNQERTKRGRGPGSPSPPGAPNPAPAPSPCSCCSSSPPPSWLAALLSPPP